MKDELTKLYQSEDFVNATDDVKVEMTTKVLGPLTMPKDVYNELNDRYKSSEAKLQTVTNEFDAYKQTKMTDEEKIQAERDNFLKSQRELTIKSNKLDVIRKLEKAGLEEADYENQLSLIVSEDAEKSMQLADWLVTTLQANSEKVKQQTQIDLLNDTPKPVVGATNVQTSNLDEYQAKYDEALKTNDQIAQARYMRLIQEEQRKQSL